jgi:hypothetical protein
MLLRARLLVLVALTGCSGGGGSVDPEESRRSEAHPAGGVPSGKAAMPEPAVEPARPIASASAEPEVSTKPEVPAKPEPPATAEVPATPEPDAFAPAPKTIARERVVVQGRTVEVRIDERAPVDEDAPPTLTFVVSLDGAKQGDRLLSLPTPTGFDYCEQSEVAVEPVEGEPSPLVLAQAFCEGGEDEFSRDILAVVVHVGDAATPPRVLWQGTGEFSSSFGVCQTLDIPLAKVPRAGTLLVEQLTEVVFDRDPDLPQIRCRAKKARTRKTAEIAF